MRNAIRILSLALMVSLLALPALAERVYFAKLSSSTAAAKNDYPANARQNVLTHITAKNNLGYGVTVEAHECYDAFDTLKVGTTAAQAVVSLESVTGFNTGESIFIQDANSACSYESAVISSISGNLLTLTANLAYSYVAGSKVWELSEIARFMPTAATETEYENYTCLAAGQIGSPLVVKTTGTTEARVSSAGYIPYGE